MLLLGATIDDGGKSVRSARLILFYLEGSENPADMFMKNLSLNLLSSKLNLN